MGQSISDLLSNNKTNESLKDQMTSLQRQAEDESDMFYDEIIRSSYETTKQIPISTVLYKFQKLEVVVQTNKSGVIVGAINDTVSAISSSSTSGIVSTLLGAAVQSLFGKSSLDYSTEEGYTISIGLLGGIERLDYKISNYCFESSTWKTEKRSVMSMTIVASACDVEKLTLHDTKTIVQNCFSAVSMLKNLTPAQEQTAAALQLKVHEFVSSQIEREILRLRRKTQAEEREEARVRDDIAQFEKWMEDDEKLLNVINVKNRELLGYITKDEDTEKALKELKDKVGKKIDH